MKRIKHFFLILVSVAFAVALAACGGGSGTSGGVVSFVGTYGGTATFTTSAPGIAPETETAAIIVVINADDTVVLDPGDEVEGAGTISGNTITATYDASLANEPGFVCTGNLDVSATGSGTSFSGTIGPSTIICNGVPITVEGTFSVAKTAKAPLQHTTLGDEIGKAIRKAAG